MPPVRARADDGHGAPPPPRWIKDSEHLRGKFEDQRVAARRRSVRLVDLLKKTVEELDQIAREDVEEVQKAVSKKADECKGCRSTGSRPTSLDGGQDFRGDDASEPAFFRDPQRAHASPRPDADADASAPARD